MSANKPAKKPISVTLDSDVLEELQSLVDQGEASSLSSLINETLRVRVERRRQSAQARAYIEEHILGRKLTEEEMIEARGMLAGVQARNAARRSAGGPSGAFAA